MDVDGAQRDVSFGSVVPVTQTFNVTPKNGYRVNVIGFSRPGLVNEAGVTLSRHEIQPAYSVDKAGSMYRVEVYRDDKFCGMVLVALSSTSSGAPKSCTSSARPAPARAIWRPRSVSPR